MRARTPDEREDVLRGDARRGPAGGASDVQLREMNAQLLVSAIRQQEIAEQALRAEAAMRQSDTKLRAHSQELARFNHAAVGRELRMVELKKEVDELTRRLGEPPRYADELNGSGSIGVQQALVAAYGAHVAAGPADDSAVALESVLRTEELGRRPSRPPDYAGENRALAELLGSLVQPDGGILQILVEKVREVLRADSAGVSLLTQDEKRFYWAAIAGVWRPHIGGGTPRDFGPCADVLRSNTPLLFQHFERRYEYLWPVTPPVEEGLLVPFCIEGRAVGALWAFSHGERRFDAEDLRLLESLGRFGAAAHFEQSRRTAALNLMQDAIRWRHTMEKAIVELRSSEERYRTLFTSIDEGFCVIEMLFDPGRKPIDFRFLETNPAFEKHSGLHAVAGKRMRELSQQHEPYWFERFGQVALTGEPVRFENKARNLGERWLDVYAFRLGGADSRKVAILFTDVSERRRLEEAAREHGQSLTELNRRKDEFLAMLSHELRTPLAAIQNAAHLLRLQPNRNSLQIEAGEMIGRQVAQLARLVDDLLEVSRISTGRIRMEMERVDLRQVVQRAVESIQSRAQQKGQSVQMALPADFAWVTGDSARLQQVVVNLLNNASKYSDHGGAIQVRLAAQTGEWVLSVRDNGVGIAPQLLPYVFDLFVQADASLDRSQGGLGLGLALVQSLVRMHGGAVEARSVLGQGSEFIVRLPLLSSPRLATAAAAGGRSAPARQLKVLVVDDDRDAAQSAMLLLQVLGHDVRMVHDGQGAVEAMVDYVPDVILLDLGLPLIDDGLQVARRIRQTSCLRDVMLVAITGHGQYADRQRAREVGFDHYLLKPVDLVKIQGILSGVVPAAPFSD